MRRFKSAKIILAVFLCVALMTGTVDTALATRSISEIEEDQDALQEEIDSLDAELYNLVLEVAEINESITTVSDEIDETKMAMIEATEARDEQYESMKIRIQYMYEAEDPSVFEMLLESGSISDFLNRMEYVNSVYDYDREKLEQFEATQAEIAELETALEEEMEELETSKTNLAAKQASLDALIAEKQDEMDDLDAELKEAKEIAAREAARRAALLASQQANTSSSSSYNVNGNLNPAQTTSISGAAVVAYANQFVGNPYVWGGTSLTNGCDCSGFIISVYANFGISFGSRITSSGLRSVGQEVSYNYMQPGDIVCYAGHVGIYQGNGLIVEAQSVATGITNTRSVNCHSIITIRRVI